MEFDVEGEDEKREKIKKRKIGAKKNFTIRYTKEEGENIMYNEAVVNKRQFKIYWQFRESAYRSFYSFFFSANETLAMMTEGKCHRQSMNNGLTLMLS